MTMMIAFCCCFQLPINAAPLKVDSAAALRMGHLHPAIKPPNPVISAAASRALARTLFDN